MNKFCEYIFVVLFTVFASGWSKFFTTHKNAHEDTIFFALFGTI